MYRINMFGLFEISYDYHKWEDLICVSGERKKLIDYHKKLHTYIPLLSKKESSDITDRKTEKEHYVIMRIKRI